MSLAQLSIDIVSDVVCPWCVIGYRQLERAIGAMAGRAEFAIRWHPFQLAPAVGPEGQSLADYSRERYGATAEQSARNRVRLVEAGAPLGIDFRYGENSRIYNTHGAHELLAWAGEVGGQTALKLELFHAYFTEQANISEPDVLVGAASKCGLSGEMARSVLTDRRYAAQVDREINHWQDQNITGVPAFIVNTKYMIPGAQDAETFVQFFDRVIAKEAVPIA